MPRGPSRGTLLAVFFLVILAVTCIEPGSGVLIWTKLTGSTFDRPGMAFFFQTSPSSEGFLYFVVRGSDNRIYYTWYDYTMGHQAPWQLVGGSTPDAPAISGESTSGSNFERFLAVRGMDDGIYWRGKNFDGAWQKLSGSTTSGPAINATSNGMLYVMVRGKDNGIYWCEISTSGLSPSQGPWHKLSGATADSPSFFMVGLDMYVAVRGLGEDMYWCKVDLGTFAQSAWQKLTGKAYRSPEIAYYDVDPNYFTIVVTGLDNRIYYQHVRISDNYQTGWTALPSGSTLRGPAIYATGGDLYAAVMGNDHGIYWTFWSSFV
jgi:hypothetical protein